LPLSSDNCLITIEGIEDIDVNTPTDKKQYSVSIMNQLISLVCHQ